jgi:outer membrane protein OmpA-like peptidoglycan-associated protein
MKKLIGIAIGGVVVLAVAATLAVVGYQQGWFGRTVVKSQVAPGGAGGATSSQGTGGHAASAGDEASRSSDVGKVTEAVGANPPAQGPGNENPSAANPASAAAAATSLPGMADEYERTVGGPEADLLVRVGAVNNLGFGWPEGFDPFSGNSTPPHPYPWTPPPGSPEGTKRIMIASVVTPMDVWNALPKGYDAHDGYSEILVKGGEPLPNAPPSQERLDSMPKPITLSVGALPDKINAVVIQMFIDDFQVRLLNSHFQVSLNGTRIPSFEDAVNSLDQSGPIGKLVTLKLLPEYWPLLQSGTVKLFIDDPTTHVPDGYAIDFVRILVNPHRFKYQVSLEASVVDADKLTPIGGATVAAALSTATTDHDGHCTLQELPAGLVTGTASAPGYDADSETVDVVAGQTGKAEFKLRPHQEATAALEKSIAETGSAKIYGIHFDTDSAKLRPDSAPALAAILGLMDNHPGSRWAIAGHTDNQGGAEHNQKLSEARAASVVSWLKAHGVAENRLVPQGFGATRPVADNGTDNGRALNRRVEIAPAK